MTNLAIKGIIGIQAMSEISQASGMRDDAQRYAVGSNQQVLQSTEFSEKQWFIVPGIVECEAMANPRRFFWPPLV
jgi:hypothetical protein